MTIAKDRVVTINYELKDAEGEVIDSSDGGEPLVYLQGHENIISGLERQLEGRVAGDKISCVISAKDGYGERDESLMFKVNKSEFGSEGKIEVGMQFEAHGEEGAQIVTVVGIEKDEVTIDANHPLAGEELHFAVEVLEVRDATSEELEHGHVHGGCGCEECGDGACEDEKCSSGCGCGCGD